MIPKMQKILLELKGYDQPLILWWTDEYLDKFKKTVSELTASKAFRIANTPSSILEISTNYYVGILETEEYDIITPQLCFEKLELYKYLMDQGIPIPKSSFNDEFQYPSTLLVAKHIKCDSVVKLDFSNYTNLDYLVSQGKSLPDHLNTKKEYLHKEFSASRFMYAEYSKMKVP